MSNSLTKYTGNFIIIYKRKSNFLSEGDCYMKKKIIAAGHICIDITPVFPKGTHCADIGQLMAGERAVHIPCVGGPIIRSVHIGIQYQIFGCSGFCQRSQRHQQQEQRQKRAEQSLYGMQKLHLISSILISFPHWGEIFLPFVVFVVYPKVRALLK